MRAKRVIVFVPLAVLTAFIAFGSVAAGVRHHSSPVPAATVPAPQVSLLPEYAPVTQHWATVNPGKPAR